MNQVKVTQHPDTGAIVNPTSNPEVFFVRVEQTKEVIDNGWLRDVTRSALINGTKEKLEGKFKKHGQVIPGTITVRESTVQEYEQKEPKINPTSGEILSKDGQPIYRYSEYNPNPAAQDGEMLQHDTVEQSESVQADQESEMSIT